MFDLCMLLLIITFPVILFFGAFANAALFGELKERPPGYQGIVDLYDIDGLKKKKD